jgi:hypothetical protein
MFYILHVWHQQSPTGHDRSKSLLTKARINHALELYTISVFYCEIAVNLLATIVAELVLPGGSLACG